MSYIVMAPALSEHGRVNVARHQVMAYIAYGLYSYGLYSVAPALSERGGIHVARHQH